MNPRASRVIERNGVRVKRDVSAQGCVIERFYVRGEGGALVENVTLSTELELLTEVRQTVLER